VPSSILLVRWPARAIAVSASSSKILENQTVAYPSRSACSTRPSSFGKGGDEFSLPLWLHGPIAGERREDVVVLKILAPRLELLGRPADFLAQVNECVPHAVRIEVRQADIVERLPEDLANGRCGLPAYADYFEFINDPRQAFRTMTLPFEGGLEFTVRVR